MLQGICKAKYWLIVSRIGGPVLVYYRNQIVLRAGRGRVKNYGAL